MADRFQCELHASTSHSTEKQKQQKNPKLEYHATVLTLWNYYMGVYITEIRYMYVNIKIVGGLLCNYYMCVCQFFALILHFFW